MVDDFEKKQYKGVVNMENIEFNDEFEEEEEICPICGGDAQVTGWNEEEELSRFECADCGAIYVYDIDYDMTILKGEKRNWEKFLAANLSFPFKGVVDEYQGEKGPIRQGDFVTVNKIMGEDDMYGVIVEIHANKKKFHFPLCDIGVCDLTSANYKIVHNYGIWFTNCQ